jgi:outer membrane protein, heavy metal efflux system
MTLIGKIVLLAALVAGCAAAPEKGALQGWERERGDRFAEEADPEPGLAATLDDYVGYALRNNPGLRAGFERWKGALEKVAPARALADLRFTYGQFLREVETRVGPQEMRLGLAQVFPWKGKLDLKGKIALQAAEEEHQRYAAAREGLIYRVRTAYYELQYLKRAVAVTEENARLLEYLEEVARAQYRGGTTAQGAVIKTQVELGRLEERLLGLRDMERPLRARLNAALGRSATAEVVVNEELVDEVPMLDGEELAMRLRQMSPELKGLDAAIARGELGIELAGKKGLPDLMVGVDYVVTGRAENPVADSGKDPVMVAASINLPLWRDKYRAGEREAKARQRAAVGQREERENQLLAELELALFGMREGERKIELYRDSLIPKAEQALNVAQQAFSAGKGDFLGVIDAQRTLLEFQLARERARADLVGKVAEVERLIGGGLTAE